MLEKPYAIDPQCTEKDFLQFVTDVANLGQWLIYHTYDSRRSQAGFPDLVLTLGGRVIFAELKTQKGRLRPTQRDWLDALSICNGVEAYLWRPSDANAIMNTLLGHRLIR